MPPILPPQSRASVDLPQRDLDWIRHLIADWQVIADLSVSDLVLWVRGRSGRFVAIAHCRPSTGQTVHLEEVVGRRMPSSRPPRRDAPRSDGKGAPKGQSAPRSSASRPSKSAPPRSASSAAKGRPTGRPANQSRKPKG